jgi:hypothetical protein
MSATSDPSSSSGVDKKRKGKSKQGRGPPPDLKAVDSTRIPGILPISAEQRGAARPAVERENSHDVEGDVERAFEDLQLDQRSPEGPAQDGLTEDQEMFLMEMFPTL